MKPISGLFPGLAAVCGFAGVCAAQQVTAPTATGAAATAPRAKEEIVELETFSVTSRRELGYVADSSVAATRFVVPLKQLPVNVQVFTEQFMVDINESDMRNLLVYSAATTGPVSQNLRAFSNQEKLKDGFKMSPFFDYPADAFQRLEIVKGPSAVIFGRSEPGGITNYVTKKPIFGQRFVELKLGTGLVNDFVRYKVAVDLNGQHSDRLAYRFVGHYTQREDFVQGTPHAALRHGKTRNTLFYPSFTYVFSPSTKLFVSYMYVDNPIFSQISRGNPSHILVPGPNNAQTPVHIAFPQFGIKSYDDYGAGRRFFYNYSDYQAVLDHTVNDTLSLRAGLSVHNRTNGDPTQTIISFASVGGVPGVRRTYGSTRSTALLPDAQIYALWRPWDGHTFSIGLSRNVTYAEFDNKLISQAPNGTFSATGYADFYPLGGAMPQGFPNDIVFRTSQRGKTTGVFDTDYINYLGAFAEKRLHVLAALAYNKYDEEDELLHRTNVNVDKLSHQFGLLYDVTKDVSVFGLKSTSMQFSAARDGYDLPFGPLFGEGLEGGAKFELLGGRLAGTIAAFHIVNKDQIILDPSARNAAYDASVSGGSPNPGLLGANVQAGEITVRGVELDFAWNFTRNWYGQFSYAFIDAEITKAPATVAAALRKGVEPAGTTPHAVSMFSRYSFAEGPLRGFYTGLGVIWKGKSNSGFVPGSTNYLYTPYYLQLNLLAGYKVDLFKRPVRFQLNVKDLTEHENLNTGYNPATGARYRTYIPRFIKFDMTLEF